MDVKVPNILTDPEQMARSIWEYWATAGKTDELEDFEVPDWDELGDEERNLFVEACRSQVVKHIEAYVEEVQFESSLDDAFDAAKPTPPMYTDKHIRKTAETKGDVALCYICASAGVSQAGRVCSRCYFSHINHIVPRREKRA